MDTIIVENVPLGFSAGDYLATGSGANLYTGSILTEGTDITGIIGIRDIEMTMRGRAIRGYGIDAVKNTQILNLEMTRLDDIMNIKLGFSDDKTVAQGLCRLWGWMDRGPGVSPVCLLCLFRVAPAWPPRVSRVTPVCLPCVSRVQDKRR